ncbi:expansin-A8-like [Ananas comosus]|uniref:Expansin n=1 Tax=Ananas comosus TaxID=4615 RepID=A0A199UJG0_ANACO|nr:expansin-A8-like [Ananas comosus]OAY64874.1 Expansin-A8 [Ananas comosus]
MEMIAANICRVLPLLVLLILLNTTSQLITVSVAQWVPATATFYGGSDASGTMAGAVLEIQHNILHFILPSGKFCSKLNNHAIWNITCDRSKSQWCKPGTYVTVTTTNFCPPNYNLPSNNDGWCNPPGQHFDMSQPAWESIAIYRGRIVPVFYRRVLCQRNGGVRFTINRNDYFDLVLITSVGGSGVLSAVWIKGSGTGWIQMNRNWGQNWQSNAYLRRQSLSFRVQTADGRVLTAYDIAPSYWGFGNTYTTNLQF